MTMAFRRVSPFVRTALVICAALAVVIVREDRIQGTNHLVHLHEVMAGANGNAKIQFLVVEQEAGGQNLWGPQGGETQSRAMLTFHDALGRETGRFKFPSSPATNGSLKVLIATQEFASLPGAPTPNFIMLPLLNPGAGKVCFRNNPLNGFAFNRNECLSYGGVGFTGATENNEFGAAFGAAAPALPITGTVSLSRTAETSSNADFVLNATPSPVNIANETFTIPVSSQTAQGELLFTNETFAGNGRSCATCHVASESFGMTPGNVQSRFATVAATFDPLFIGERKPSAFDAGFDFNLNTLTLAAAPVNAAPCHGELRGIITTPNSGRARVLGRVSGTEYLVMGGANPSMAGQVVSDSNSCSATATTVVSRGLATVEGASPFGLEDPRRMRTSTDTTRFPQGRALILENVDGTTPVLTAHVFRKSPHLLNLSRTAPFGFSGDVANLQDFLEGAINQHYPRTLARSSSSLVDPDFRTATAAEKAAAEAFMLAQEFPAGAGTAKFNLDRFAVTQAQIRGRALFEGSAKCSQCHGGLVMAATTVAIQGKGVGINAAFNTGVVNQAINSSGQDNLPPDGTSREFSVPQLFNAQRLAPFFHDNSAATVHDAVEFYSSPAFNNSPAGQAIGGIAMSAQNLNDLVAFLESLDHDPSVETIANQTVPTGSSTSALALTLGDPDTALTTLTPTATSSNPTVVPNANVVFGGSGGNRTVTVTPVAGQLGSATITISVSDGTAATTMAFTVTATPPNTVPTISAITAQTTAEDTATAAIAVTVGDAETAVSSLTVSATASNTTLIPNASIATGGTGANRTVTVTPATNLSGTSTITVTVSDGTLSTSTAFVLTVTAVNDLPTIAAIAAQSTAEDTATGAIAVTIGDIETAAGSLTLSATSSNTAVVPNAGIAGGGSGANRTLTLTPAADQFGAATITVTVNDGTASESATFALTVTSVNDAPTIAAIAAQSTAEDTPTSAIAVTVGDLETAPASLSLSATSSNTTLVPGVNIAAGGSGANRTVTLTPAADLSGTSTITVTANDGTTTTSTTFELTVTAVNDAPTISAIAAQSTVTATSAIAFTVSDIETPAPGLTVSATSSNVTLVPNANIVLGGSGANRTITLTPVGNKAGTTTITVAVSDGTTPATASFVLTVSAPPTLTTPPVNVTAVQGANAQLSAVAAGDPAPTYQWQVSVNGGATFDNMTNESPYTGATAGTLLVTAAPAGLNATQYRVVATNASGSVTSDAVTLTVFGTANLNPEGLKFTATKNGTSLANVTAAQTALVTFNGAASAWTASSNRPWLQLSSASGSAAGQLTAAVVNPGDVIGTATTLTATITLTPALSGLAAATLPVTLTVKAAAALESPFGFMDTPAAGANVAGSIAVSGWALDDVGVDRVEIWRDLVAGETTPPYPGPGLGAGKVFIADALFVTGARPDIESSPHYSTYPLSTRAGWGYLLLTQGLWNQGNGPFTLHAFAYDTDGHGVSLGSKAITVSNSTSTRPFGSIDVPTYGQTVTSSFWNFGWALTPSGPTCSINSNGVQVAIDSGPLRAVSYGDFRPDIAAAFPGFANGAGAGGSYFIDTTALSNGTHQIGWFIVDICGRSEGIGSRFFTVLNAASAVPAEESAGNAARPEGVSRRDVSAAVDVHRGLDAVSVDVNPAGTRVVPIAAGERAEVRLPAGDGVTYNGYQIVNGARRPLPIGSSLDPAQGIFYWQPGPGFLGAHDLEFVSSQGGVVRVRAVIGTAVQAVIDTPHLGVPVGGVFTVAGWAIDEAATAGTGIDAVHVWAYPATGEAPIFLGVADYGGIRPDVGALFGEQFSASSYSLSVEGLAPGAWDLVVYPHSAVTSDFHGAQRRRVIVQ